MSHKQLWNALVHSRETWPFGHPLHDLDVMVLGVFLFMCFILWVIALEWGFCRWDKRMEAGELDHEWWIPVEQYKQEE